MKKIEIPKAAKILVVSNNPFSKTKNNGKTLSSFFCNLAIGKNQIRQLFFSDETPESDFCDFYYKISDYDVLTSTFSKIEPGNCINESKIPISIERNSIITEFKKMETVRLLREAIWKNKLDSFQQLINWVKEFEPNILFFCAGDSLFVYEIVQMICDIVKCKLIIYVTDDYILPIKGFNYLKRYRRNLIKNKMKKCIENSDVFLTICDEMRLTYKKIFEKDSITMSNVYYSESTINNEKIQGDKHLKVMYAGGIHFNRHKVLIKIAQTIENYNKTQNENVSLILCFNELPQKKIVNKFSKFECVKLLINKTAEELKLFYESVDILIHVESFDKKSIESTRLSFSTKITEYMATGKCIIAVGPKNVASINYLDQVCFVIDDLNKLEENMMRVLTDDKFRTEIRNKTNLCYKNNHEPVRILNKLSKVLYKLLEK